MNKIIQSLIRHIKVRPICGICTLIIVAVVWYVNGSYFNQKLYQYTDYSENILHDNGYDNGEQIELIGIVDSYSFDNSFGQMIQTVYLKKVSTIKGDTITGPFEKIKTTFPTETKLNIGQKICFSGQLKYFETATNPGEFDSLRFNCCRGILFMVSNCHLKNSSSSYSDIRQWLYQMRLNGEHIFSKYLDVEDAAIMKAMIWGNKNEIPSETKEMFQKNGIAHILAISGVVISILGK